MEREPGAMAPAPRVVRAGPISALLDGGFLRRIRVGPHEVLRGVYAAVRDHNWDTIEPRYERYRLEQDENGFRVSFRAEHRSGDVDFFWDGLIVGEASGRITFTLDGVCRRPFRKNRLGFCVLHPPEVAGTPYVRETPGGLVEERFPERISPSRDVVDMLAIRYAVGPVGVELRFDGDLFDMEDQRNWTDASFKTFCTPLARPYPVRMEAGQRVRQTVTLDLPNAGEVGGTKAPGGAEPDVVVRHRALGALPGIGLGAPCHGRPLTAAAAALLRGLALTHLRVELDLRGRAWRDPLGAATADATGLGVGLEVAAVTERTGSGLEELAAALARSSVPVLRVVPFAEDGWVTTPGLVARARAAGLPGKVGGGSRTDFAQFNMLRARLPVGQIDFAAYAINPQVHAFDDMSMLETLGVQTETVSSARGLAGDVPIAVGPITLRPRFNPNATAPEPPRRGDEPPRHADPRQTRGFAAAWTVGSLHRLGAAGAAAVTYFETAGPCGVLDEAGAPYPVYDVFAAVGSFAGAEVLDVGLRDPLEVEALALRDGGRVRIVVGNLTPTARQVVVAPPTGTARVLDLGPYGVAAIDAG